MSRVDEAMRRAAEQNLSGATAGADLEANALQTEFADATELSREAFPLEMPERRRVRSSPFPTPVSDLKRQVAAPEHKRQPLIERIDPRLAQKVVIDQRILPASREQYRQLAATLHHAQAANGTKVVMIASAVPGEGKTLTASNLALTLSESYRRTVLLIDADLRKPALHAVFGVGNTSGLGDGLSCAEERKLLVQQVSPHLAVLTAGVASPDPMAGLTSERMRRLLDEGREAFDWVIMDTPPVAFLTDANLLAAMVDAAIVVVKACSTDFELVQRAVEAIGRERTLGVVLNQAESSTHSSSYSKYSHYYQNPGSTEIA